MWSSKWKKLRLYQILLWGGFVLFFIGLVLRSWGWIHGTAVLIMGLAASIIAVFRMDRHYRCPRCGASLAGAGGSHLDVLLCRLPRYCPKCGWLVKEDEFPS